MDFTALPSMELGYDMVMVVDKDMKKMQAKMDVTMQTVPVIPGMEQNLMTAYIDFDITNAESPKYRMIMKNAGKRKISGNGLHKNSGRVADDRTTAKNDRNHDAGKNPAVE